MKCLAVILSLYFAVLAVQPCADDQPEVARSYMEMAAADGHEHASDLCSPFCSCACCGVHVLGQEFTFSLAVGTPVRENFDTLPSAYQSRLHSAYFGSIWQPPQIV